MVSLKRMLIPSLPRSPSNPPSYGSAVHETQGTHSPNQPPSKSDDLLPPPPLHLEPPIQSDPAEAADVRRHSTTRKSGDSSPGYRHKSSRRTRSEGDTEGTYKALGYATGAPLNRCPELPGRAQEADRESQSAGTGRLTPRHGSCTSQSARHAAEGGAGAKTVFEAPQKQAGGYMSQSARHAGEGGAGEKTLASRPRKGVSQSCRIPRAAEAQEQKQQSSRNHSDGRGYAKSSPLSPPGSCRNTSEGRGYAKSSPLSPPGSCRNVGKRQGYEKTSPLNPSGSCRNASEGQGYAKSSPLSPRCGGSLAPPHGSHEPPAPAANEFEDEDPPFERMPTLRRGNDHLRPTKARSLTAERAETAGSDRQLSRSSSAKPEGPGPSLPGRRERHHIMAEGMVYTVVPDFGSQLDAVEAPDFECQVNVAKGPEEESQIVGSKSCGGVDKGKAMCEPVGPPDVSLKSSEELADLVGRGKTTTGGLPSGNHHPDVPHLHGTQTRYMEKGESMEKPLARHGASDGCGVRHKGRLPVLEVECPDACTVDVDVCSAQGLVMTEKELTALLFEGVGIGRGTATTSTAKANHGDHDEKEPNVQVLSEKFEGIDEANGGGAWRSFLAEEFVNEARRRSSDVERGSHGRARLSCLVSPHAHLAKAVYPGIVSPSAELGELVNSVEEEANTGYSAEREEAACRRKGRKTHRKYLLPLDG